jgi:hypothetical protein
VSKEKNMKQDTKPASYKIGKYDAYCERPTAFKYYLLNYRRRENLVIEALSQHAMDSMITWLTLSRTQMVQISNNVGIPLPRKVLVQFEDKIVEVNIGDVD